MSVEGVKQLFADGRVIDLHVNVGKRVEDCFYDGELGGEHVQRQYSLQELVNVNLQRIGLRSHYGSIELSPDLEFKFLPSVAVNFTGVNPVLIDEQLSVLPGKKFLLWFQSFRDPHHREARKKIEVSSKIPISGVQDEVITHTDELGRLSKETLEVLEVARDYRAIVATPHSNYERTIPLIVQAIQMGLTVIWVHPDSRLIKTPIQIQKALANEYSGNLFIERAAIFLRDGKPGAYIPEQIVRDIRAIGIENVIVTSDAGRYKAEDPLMPEEALSWYVGELVSAGMMFDEVEMVTHINPLRIIEG